MRKLTVVAFLLGLSLAVGQAQTDIATTDAGPNLNLTQGTRDPGDFIYSIDVEGLTGDIRCLGVEMDGTDWWITGAADMAGAYLYRIDGAGATVLNAYATGHTGWAWRDIAWDGSYLYASDSYQIEQIDPVSGSVTGTSYTSPISPARALAWDPNGPAGFGPGCFWTASFSSDVYWVRKDGTNANFANTPNLSIYGAAMDEVTDVLWIWSQNGSTGSLASAFDPRNGIFTGESWDGDAGIGGIAGGACIFDHPAHGTVFAGLHQASPDSVGVYDIQLGTMPVLDIKCNGKDSNVNVALFLGPPVITIDVEARQGAGYPVDIFCVIQRGTIYYAYDGSSWTPGLGGCYFTGPLADMSDTILNMNIPLGSYLAYLALDVNADGVLQVPSVFDYDVVDFNVIP